MGFIVVLILTTLAIAGSAAFFSIYGLAQIFSGAFIAVVIMGSALEAGKLVAASFLYRYWHTITVMMRSYLIASVGVLMLITSAGIFGFLSQAHIAANASLNETSSRITLLQEDKQRNEQLKQERLTRRQQIDKDISQLPSDYVKGRQRLIASFGSERKRIDQEILQYDTNIATISAQIADLKISKQKEESHVGPILFIAEAMNKDVNAAITWMIMMIMFAFDPLAVALTIGVNIAFSHRRKLIEEATAPSEPPPVVVNTPAVEAKPEPESHDSGEYFSADEIREALKQISDDDSPEKIAHREALQEMVRRKELKQQTRNSQPNVKSATPEEQTPGVDG